MENQPKLRSGRRLIEGVKKDTSINLNIEIVNQPVARGIHADAVSVNY